MIRQCNRHFNALRDELEGVNDPPARTPMWGVGVGGSANPPPLARLGCGLRLASFRRHGTMVATPESGRLSAVASLWRHYRDTFPSCR